MRYRVAISAVDGERLYLAAGSDRAELLRFMQQYDHEGSAVELVWFTDDGVRDDTDDPERVYRILNGEEVVS